MTVQLVTMLLLPTLVAGGLCPIKAKPVNPSAIAGQTVSAYCQESYIVNVTTVVQERRQHVTTFTVNGTNHTKITDYTVDVAKVTPIDRVIATTDADCECPADGFTKLGCSPTVRGQSGEWIGWGPMYYSCVPEVGRKGLAIKGSSRGGSGYCCQGEKVGTCVNECMHFPSDNGKSAALKLLITPQCKLQACTVSKTVKAVFGGAKVVNMMAATKEEKAITHSLDRQLQLCPIKTKPVYPSEIAGETIGTHCQESYTVNVTTVVQERRQHVTTFTVNGTNHTKITDYTVDVAKVTPIDRQIATSDSDCACPADGFTKVGCSPAMLGKSDEWVGWGNMYYSCIPEVGGKGGAIKGNSRDDSSGYCCQGEKVGTCVNECMYYPSDDGRSPALELLITPQCKLQACTVSKTVKASFGGAHVVNIAAEIDAEKAETGEEETVQITLNEQQQQQQLPETGEEETVQITLNEQQQQQQQLPNHVPVTALGGCALVVMLLIVGVGFVRRQKSTKLTNIHEPLI